MSEIKLKQLNIVYQLKRKRNIKNLSLKVYPSGQVIVSAPYFYPKFLISNFLEKKSDWLKKKLSFWKNSQMLPISEKTRADYLKDKERARQLIINRLEFFNQYYNFKYEKIRIKNQKISWGSCSKKSNLNFNFRILYLPEKMRDYIIVHELCHLKELNHSNNFWQLVAFTIPDYKDIRKQLKRGLLN
jgi:predicted metal-dependent hydrolase